jgi:hypothetical protein
MEEINELKEAIVGILYAPLNSCVNNMNAASSLRDFLNASAPQNLMTAIVAGGNNFLQSEYGQHVSQSTFQLIQTVINQLEKSLPDMYYIWQRLDHYDKNGAWLGVNSREVAFGDAMGDAITGHNPWGRLAGELFGLIVANERIQKEVQAASELYSAKVNEFINTYSGFAENNLIDSIFSDYSRAFKEAETQRENSLEQLTKIVEMKNQGYINDQEFEKMKAQILKDI